MKIIKYQLMSEVDCDTEEEANIVQTFSSVEIKCNDSNFEENCAVAQKEAYNGEYTVEDDGQPEPDTTTTDDVLSALLGVTA